jgi:hypothetical protein
MVLITGLKRKITKMTKTKIFDKICTFSIMFRFLRKCKITLRFNQRLIREEINNMKKSLVN